MDNLRNFKGLDKSVRKQKIIDTAAYLFHKKGYISTTLDDVSKKLGLSKAALYHYVSSKDELLSIIYTQTFNNIFMDTNKISNMDLPPDEKLRLILHKHIKNIIIKSLPMFSVFFSEETQLPEKDYQKIREEKRKYNRIVEEILKEGISKGIFTKVDIKLQSYAILGMCNWIYKWYKPDQKKYTPDQIADHIIALLEAGYLKNKLPVGEKDSEGIQLTNKKYKTKVKKQTLDELRRQCMVLIELIEEAKKTI
jgi:AcrR family transcriptional regulator